MIHNFFYRNNVSLDSHAFKYRVTYILTKTSSSTFSLKKVDEPFLLDINNKIKALKNIITINFYKDENLLLDKVPVINKENLNKRLLLQQLAVYHITNIDKNYLLFPTNQSFEIDLTKEGKKLLPLEIKFNTKASHNILLKEYKIPKNIRIKSDTILEKYILPKIIFNNKKSLQEYNYVKKINIDPNNIRLKEINKNHIDKLDKEMLLNEYNYVKKIDKDKNIALNILEKKLFSVKEYTKNLNTLIKFASINTKKIYLDKTANDIFRYYEKKYYFDSYKNINKLLDTKLYSKVYDKNITVWRDIKKVTKLTVIDVDKKNSIKLIAKNSIKEFFNKNNTVLLKKYSLKDLHSTNKNFLLDKIDSNELDSYLNNYKYLDKQTIFAIDNTSKTKFLSIKVKINKNGSYKFLYKFQKGSGTAKKPFLFQKVFPSSTLVIERGLIFSEKKIFKNIVVHKNNFILKRISFNYQIFLNEVQKFLEKISFNNNLVKCNNSQKFLVKLSINSITKNQINYFMDRNDIGGEIMKLLNYKIFKVHVDKQILKDITMKSIQIGNTNIYKLDIKKEIETYMTKIFKMDNEKNLIIYTKSFGTKNTFKFLDFEKLHSIIKDTNLNMKLEKFSITFDKPRDQLILKEIFKANKINKYDSKIVSQIKRDLKMDKENSILVEEIRRKGIINKNPKEKYLELNKRWWFLKPTINKIKFMIPRIDYPYESSSIFDLEEHPFQEFKGMAYKNSIEVSIEIFVDLVNIIMHWWNQSAFMFQTAFGDEAMKALMSVLFNWYNLETSLTQLRQLKVEEEYLRCFRLIRWFAEAEYFTALNDKDNNKLYNGNVYIGNLVNNLLSFLEDDYYDIVPLYKDINRMSEARTFIGNDVNDDIIFTSTNKKKITLRNYLIEN